MNTASLGSRLISALSDKRVQSGLLFAGLAIGLSAIAYFRSQAQTDEPSPPKLQTALSIGLSPAGLTAMNQVVSADNATDVSPLSTTEVFNPAIAVSKSLGGKSGGVHFVTLPDSIRVLKAVKNPVQIQLAHTVATQFDIHVPRSVLLRKDEMPDTIRTLSPEISTLLDDTTHTDHIVEMEIVVGKNIHEFMKTTPSLTPSEKRALLKECGKIVIFDMAMLNMDRFKLSDSFEDAMNTGNLMITQTGDDDARMLTIVAIDQAFCEMPQFIDFEGLIEIATAQVANLKNKSEIGTMVLHRLNTLYPDTFGIEDRDLKTAVVEGMEDAIPKFIALKENIAALNTASTGGKPVASALLERLQVPSDDRDDRKNDNFASLQAINFKELEKYYEGLITKLGVS